MTDLIFALRWFLINIRAYVAGNLFIYYEQGNPKAVVAPDVFVVLGVDPEERRTYRVWEEGGYLPEVVIELTSKKTRKADQIEKPALYAQLGIREYFLFDPHGEWLRPRLQGFRLANGAYEPIKSFLLHSTVLGLELRIDENVLRLYNAKTGERLPTSHEEVIARRAAEARADAAERRAAEAEAELARLRAEAGELRAEAEAEARRVAEQRATEAEAELARLRAERGEL